MARGLVARRYGTIQRRLRAGKRTKYYYVAYYDDATQRSGWVSTRCTSLRAARAYVGELESGRSAPQVRSASSTLSRAIDSWLTEKDGRVSDRYLENLTSSSLRWRSWLGESAALAAVSTADLEAFLRQRRAGTLESEAIPRERSASTLNTEIGYLRSFFAWCVDTGLIESSPARRLPPFKGEMRRRTRYLSRAEETALLAACRDEYTSAASDANNRTSKGGARKRKRGGKWKQTFRPPEYLYVYVLLTLRSGFRARTIRELQWEHVDLDAGRWRVPAEHFKGNADFEQPMAESLVKALRERRDDTSARGLVFPEVNPRSLRRAFKNAAERAGLPGMTLHDCRRVFLNRLREAGVGIDVAMALTTHESLETVLKHYREVQAGEAADAVRRLE